MGLISATQTAMETEAALLTRLQNGAAAVRRGVRLLDHAVPRWRTVMRRHAADFDLGDSDHCVLGTLEHQSGLKRLGKTRVTGNAEAGYFTALERLGITNRGEDYGFEGAQLSYAELEALWRAEFSR